MINFETHKYTLKGRTVPRVQLGFFVDRDCLQIKSEKENYVMLLAIWSTLPNSSSIEHVQWKCLWLVYIITYWCLYGMSLLSQSYLPYSSSAAMWNIWYDFDQCSLHMDTPKTTKVVIPSWLWDKHCPLDSQHYLTLEGKSSLNFMELNLRLLPKAIIRNIESHVLEQCTSCWWTLYT